MIFRMNTIRDGSLNSLSAGSAGEAEKLLIYSFGEMSVADNTTLSALIYTQKIEVSSNSHLFGAISASGELVLGQGTRITFQPNAPATADLGSLCDSDDSALDHLRILHDGQALTCAPEQVSIRACKNSACDELYEDSITVDLLPSGWIGGDSVSITGGETTTELRHTIAESDPWGQFDNGR